MCVSRDGATRHQTVTGLPGITQTVMGLPGIRL